MDDLALNPWPEYCLNVKWANPNELADSASPSQPCLWPRLLRAARNTGEKQGLSQAVRGELGPAAWHPLALGKPGRVFVNSTATCTRATWELGRPNLQTAMGRGATGGSKPECSRSIVFHSSLQRYQISKHGREKSICPSRSTASVSIQRRCMS